MNNRAKEYQTHDEELTVPLKKFDDWIEDITC
jgi:hypothetical protein